MGEREAFLKKLQATFRVEAEEHLKALSSGFVELEQAKTRETRAAVVEAVYREAHSLKGAARAVNMRDIETASHALEGALAAVKRGEIDPSPGLFDTLYRSIDALGKLLSAPGEVSVPEVIQALARLAAGEGERREDAEAGEPDLLGAAPEQDGARPDDPEAVVAGPEAAETPGERPAMPADEGSPRGEKGVPGGEPGAAETVRISTAKLDALLLQTEEMLSAKLSATQRAADLRGVSAAMGLWKKAWARVSPEVRRLRQSLEEVEGRNGQGRTAPQGARLLAFLEWNEAHMKSLDGRLADLAALADRDRRSVGAMVDGLLEDMKEALMHPFSSFSEGFPRLVRDLCRGQGKEVDLALQGGQVEIDRRILEQMKDPVVHLLRNAVDHGIETPEARQRSGKPVRGRVTVALSQVGSNRVELLISDDGAGIDPAGVKAAAVGRGAISAEEAEGLDEQGALRLIFQSGVSTSSLITDISGRGLGMAIVREKVEGLGGAVAVESRPGMGTAFRLLLPLALATFRGILVQAAGRTFVAPTAGVERVARVHRDDIRTVENRQTVPLNGYAVPLVRLEDVLELPRNGGKGETPVFTQALVVGAAEKRIAFGVDAVLGEQVVLVKGLGKQLSRVRNISGATVLGSGQVVPILNASDLLKSAVRAKAFPVGAATGPAEPQADGILVVEDSITSRMLLKNILETAGYRVRTSVDGVDALTALKTEAFDLVVSDVEMPRMDGFDLTAAIRADKKLAELPVVLVTALESKEDRERGVDAGANAYIVKSSFDQSNLLEVIRRLV